KPAMILFYLLVTVMPMIRHPLWSDFIGDLTVIKYLGLACLIYAVVYLPLRATSLRLFATWQIRFFVAWALLVMFLFLRYGDARLPLEVSSLMSFASLLALLFVTLTVVDSLHRLRWVLVMALHTRRRLTMLVIALVVTLPLMAVAPSSPLPRIVSPNQHDVYAAQHRADLAWAGLRMFQSHLLTGIGPGNFKPLLGRFADLDEHHVAHNSFI